MPDLARLADNACLQPPALTPDQRRQALSNGGFEASKTSAATMMPNAAARICKKSSMRKE